MPRVQSLIETPLTEGYRRGPTTFADGTTVTVDWDTNSVAVSEPATAGRSK